MEELPVDPRAAEHRTWLPAQDQTQAASLLCQPQQQERPSPEPLQPKGPPQQQLPTTAPATPLPQAAASVGGFPAVRPLPPWHLRPNVAPQSQAAAAPTLVSWIQAIARTAVSAGQLATALATRTPLTPDELAKLAEANATDTWQVQTQADTAVSQLAYLTALKQAPLPPPVPFPPPPLAPPPLPSAEPDPIACRRFQRAVVQAMRYRRKKATLYDGISFDGLRALLPKRAGAVPPTDADILHAVQISGGRLWTTSQNDGTLIYCAPKDHDQQQETSLPDDTNYYDMSVAASSLRYPSSSAPRPPAPKGRTPYPHAMAPASTKCRPHQRPQQHQREEKPPSSPSPCPSRSPPRRARKTKSPKAKSPPLQHYALTAEQAQFIRAWEQRRAEDHEQPRKKRKKNRPSHHSPAAYRIDSTEEADLHADDTPKAKGSKRKYREDA